MLFRDSTRHLQTDHRLEYTYLGNWAETDHGEVGQRVRRVNAKRAIRYGDKRLEKLFYCGRAKVQTLERIGVDVRTQGPAVGRYMTNHLGLMGDVLVVKDA